MPSLCIGVKPAKFETPLCDKNENNSISGKGDLGWTLDRRVASEANIHCDIGRDTVGGILKGFCSGKYGIILNHRHPYVFTNYVYSLFKTHLNGFIEDHYKKI